MKLITVYFPRNKNYTKFLRVFKRSAKKHMPKTTLKVITLPVPVNIDHKRDTAHGFIAAAEYAVNSEEDLAVADVDLMFQRSIADVWKKDFDIAVTTRDYRAKYNTGLWFYRPNKRTRKFMVKWLFYTRLLVDEFEEYKKLIGEHGGIDQASLYLAIKHTETDFSLGINILELPCQEWNSCQTEWMNVNENTRVIHIKSKLRLAATGKREIPEGMEYMKPLVKEWREYLK